MKLSILFLSQIGYLAALSYADFVSSAGIEQSTENTAASSFVPSESIDQSTENTEASSFVPIEGIERSTENTTAASTFWFENIKRSGSTVYRNVKAFGAKGDGVTDDTAAIQSAIRGKSTGRSVIYFPSGTYLVSSGLKASSWSVFSGDPTDRPVIKASAGFSGTALLTGSVRASSGLSDFFRTIKDLVFDTTAVPPTKSLSIIIWSLSQGSQIQNVLFNMPIGSTGHIGISSTGTNSPTFLNDLQFNGGSVGLSISDTQYQLKSMFFNGL
jgi:glucan 1,3-beta-glucosidase